MFMFDINILDNEVDRLMLLREIDHCPTSRIVSIIHFPKAEVYSKRQATTATPSEHNEEFLGIKMKSNFLGSSTQNILNRRCSWR